MVRKKTPPLQIIKNRATWFIRSLNSGSRVLPDFIIIGAAKGGTTSLFNYLAMHPQVASPLKKEVHYFDRNYHRGLSWYKMHFPTRQYMAKHASGGRFITGEASPYYLSHPLAAARIKALLPEVKMIVLLRNPVDRALSNYQHMVRLGIETEPIDKAISLEESRTAGESEKLINNPYYYSFNHHHFSYTARGIYWKELQPWFKEFPREQFLIAESEQFYRNPGSVFSETTRFLGLNNWEPQQYKTFNSGGDYQPVSESFRKELIEFFRPHNARLAEITGLTFDWNK